ncbi:FtsB family cell division protein [Arthrobacter gengyunqii]|uniref:Septum formation initiator family protein n=1 Tax=Arthrobacter gengyunqii TaxID=2886940 RepID=A0ABS8GJ51_9MICC|nr:septum formation initiator family protein [Arthrobacter gengyunqii]MCC3266682.1 septum formation initiator family protein [Arthrobacter gengyunqii]
MPTRRPKVPKAGSGADGSNAGGRTGRTADKPARRRNAAADPDTISAVKPVDSTSSSPKTGSPKTDPPGTGSARTAKPRAVNTAAQTAKPRAKAAKQPSAPGTGEDPVQGKAAAAAGRLRRRSRILSEGSAAGPSAEETSDDLRPVPAKAFSGRLLVLAMVTLVVTVLLAPSVNTYLHQRSDIAALEAEIAEQKETSQSLEARLERWEDPNYIKQQARERIFLVMPGESRYLVKGEHGVEDVEQEAQEQEEDLQWVDALWDSVKRSANAP